MDGFEDGDGCPDNDNDGDGIPDAQDKCPNCPEDKDGFQDADGCPDLDNDHDGIPDAQDKCPNEPETINGIQDDDGCPDTGGVELVHLDGDRLTVDRTPTLDTATKLSARGAIITDDMALVMAAHGEVTKWLVAVAMPNAGDAKKLGDAVKARILAKRTQLKAEQIEVLAAAGATRRSARVVQERAAADAPFVCPDNLVAHERPDRAKKPPAADAAPPPPSNVPASPAAAGSELGLGLGRQLALALTVDRGDLAVAVDLEHLDRPAVELRRPTSMRHSLPSQSLVMPSFCTVCATTMRLAPSAASASSTSSQSVWPGMPSARVHTGLSSAVSSDAAARAAWPSSQHRASRFACVDVRRPVAERRRRARTRCRRRSRPRRGRASRFAHGPPGAERGQARAAEVVRAARRDVAEVVRGVHQLVVAEQLHDRAAGGVRLVGEAREQLEDRRLVVAAIEHVAGLHDDEVAADPVVVRVDRAGGAERGARGGQVAVEIADRDEPLRRRARHAERMRRERAAGDRNRRGGRRRGCVACRCA